MPVALAALAGSVAFVAYTLAGYPAMLVAVVALRKRRREAAAEGPEMPSPVGTPPPSEHAIRGEAAGPLPRVSLTLPAYNEEAQIRDTLRSLLALDYPRDRLQLLIVSDGSTDCTDAIVRSFAGEGVQLLRVDGRRGKSAVENAARAHLEGDIVVNTDASVRLHPGAVRALVAAFRDPGVGVASGRDVSISRGEDDANAGESGYVGYEMWIRDLETAAGGIVGSSGCLYAIRKPLHDTPVPAELSRDFSSALIAREQGYRAVSVRDAICYVPRAGSLRKEYTRKVRTIARGARTLFTRRHLMNPLEHGVFAWMLVSHKLCRWLMPWALVAAGVALLFLAAEAPWARWLVGLGGVAALAAAVGWLWPEDRDAPRIFTLPAYFMVGNVATLHAWFRLLGGRHDAVWEPTRRASMREAGAATSAMEGSTSETSAGGSGRLTTPRS